MEGYTKYQTIVPRDSDAKPVAVDARKAEGPEKITCPQSSQVWHAQLGDWIIRLPDGVRKTHIKDKSKDGKPIEQKVLGKMFVVGHPVFYKSYELAKPKPAAAAPAPKPAPKPEAKSESKPKPKPAK
jgi:hypothetical protein